MPDQKISESDRPSPLLVPYIATVVLLAIGGVILITQQARMVRMGHEMARARSEAAREETAIRRLELRVARLKSVGSLMERAERFELKLVPPEDAPVNGEIEGTATP